MSTFSIISLTATSLVALYAIYRAWNTERSCQAFEQYLRFLRERKFENAETLREQHQADRLFQKYAALAKNTKPRRPPGPTPADEHTEESGCPVTFANGRRAAS